MIRCTEFGRTFLHKERRVLLIERSSSERQLSADFGEYSNWRERGFDVAIRVITYRIVAPSGSVYIAAKNAETASLFGEFGLIGARFEALGPRCRFRGEATEVTEALSVARANDILLGSKLATEIAEILLGERQPVVVAPEEYQYSSYRPPEPTKRPLAPAENLPHERVSRKQISDRLGEMWSALVLPEDLPSGGISDDTQFNSLQMQDSNGPAVWPSMLQAIEHCFGIDPSRGLPGGCQYDMGETVGQLKNWLYWECNRPM